MTAGDSGIEERKTKTTDKSETKINGENKFAIIISVLLLLLTAA